MGENENKLRKKDWIVKPISIGTARMLVEKYHYAKSASNTATYTFGLFKIGEDFFETQAVGCSWWLPPTKSSAQVTYPEGEWQKVLSLSRLAIAPDVPKNACSFLLAGSIKMIDNEKWECLVTYADQWQNHTGAIYRATNWQYMGETKPSAVFQKNGKMMGRKRGQRTWTKKEILDDGFEQLGNFKKHKFRMLIRPFSKINCT